MRAPASLVIALALAVALLAFARARYAPPPPRPASAPSGEFSAARALDTLARVLGDGAPHPAGTPAEARVRERIVAELARAGLAARLERSFACGRYGSCGSVVDVVAELPGATGGTRDAVLVSAHYDSVPAAAGANDDGAGVAAALEIARALTSSARLARSVIFVFDDAEEDGLLGATAFARSAPDFSRVRAVVNMDARGSRGPAMIFETSADSAAVARILAQTLERPVTSSLFSTIYRRMPNDTDFTVFKRAGTGANIAYLGGAAAYHTALDRLDRVDAGAVQQEGDAALALVRALAVQQPLPGGEAVWFDVLAFGVIVWDAAWSGPLAMGALGLVALGAAALARRRQVTLVQALTGAGVLPLALPGALLVGLLVADALQRDAVPAAWTANAGWALAAAWLTGAAGATVSAAVLARAAALGQSCGTWILLALVGVGLAAAIPGASYLLVVPALIAGASALASARLGDRLAPAVAVLPPALASLVVFAPVLLLLYDAVGVVAMPLATVLGALLASTLTPLVAPLAPRARVLLASAMVLGVVVSSVVAAYAAPFSAETPSRVNVVFAQDDTSARVIVDPTWGSRPWGPIPPPMRDALGSAARTMERFPWARDQVLAAPAPRADLAAPSAEVLASTADGARRRLTLRVRSLRGASSLAVLVPPEVEAQIARAESVEVPGASTASWHGLRLIASPDEGLTVELTGPESPFEIVLLDETSGVPPAAAPVVGARPPSATPSQRGDSTIVTRRVRL